MAEPFQQVPAPLRKIRNSGRQTFGMQRKAQAVDRRLEQRARHALVDFRQRVVRGDERPVAIEGLARERARGREREKESVG